MNPCPHEHEQVQADTAEGFTLSVRCNGETLDTLVIARTSHDPSVELSSFVARTMWRHYQDRIEPMLRRAVELLSQAPVTCDTDDEWWRDTVALIEAVAAADAR